MISGNKCFEWVDQQQEELEAGPTLGPKGGFEAGSYSFLESSGSSADSVVDTNTFSFLGAEDGSQGIDHNVANSNNNANANNTLSPQKIQEQRQMEMRQKLM